MPSLIGLLGQKALSLAQKPVFPQPKKRPAPIDPSVLASQQAALTPAAAFPLGRYLSLLSVFSLLLIFTLIGLPQSSFPFPLSTPRQKTSLDRPEWAWVAVLTRDPLATTVWVVAGAGVVCAWWASQLGKMWEEEEQRKKGAKGVVQEKEEDEIMRITKGTSKAVETIKIASVSTLVSSVILHCCLILLGAPLRFSPQTQAETYCLSLVLAVLTVYTPVYVLGYPPLWASKNGLGTWVWNRLFIEVDLRTPLERALVYPPLFSFLGAFIGAFPIALDWDRPWQAWPLTPLTGAILGCVAGNYYSFALSAWETALELGAEAEAKGPAASTPVKKQAAKKSVAGAGKGKVKKA